MMTTVDITYYKGKLARVEVESLVNPLRDKEPTPVWRKHFRDVLRHFKMTKETLQILTTNSDKRNQLGRHYTKNTLDNIIQHYQDKTNGWTPNAQKTVNDHLDVLVDYLSRPDDQPADPFRNVTSFDVKDTQLQQAVSTAISAFRKPIHPKTGCSDTDKPLLGESWVDYGNRLVQQNIEAEAARTTKSVAEIAGDISLDNLSGKIPRKVKLTKIRVHIIRR